MVEVVEVVARALATELGREDVADLDRLLARAALAAAAAAVGVTQPSDALQGHFIKRDGTTSTTYGQGVDHNRALADALRVHVLQNPEKQRLGSFALDALYRALADWESTQ